VSTTPFKDTVVAAMAASACADHVSLGRQLEVRLREFQRLGLTRDPVRRITAYTASVVAATRPIAGRVHAPAAPRS
jgi:hypothetical protein